jgi:hypothetical protein
LPMHILLRCAISSAPAIWCTRGMRADWIYLSVWLLQGLRALQS